MKERKPTLDKSLLRIDNTKRSAASTCLRLYYWKHVRFLQPTYGSTSLRYGIVWHEAMDAYYSYIARYGWTRDGKALEAAVRAAHQEWEHQSLTGQFYEDYRNLPNLLTSLLRFVSHFATDEGMLTILDSERVFECSICPTEAECSAFPGLRPFTFTGIIDLIVNMSGMLWILDHKTTGQPLYTQVDRLNRSAQFKGYWYATKQITREHIAGFLVCFHHLSCYKRKDGSYGDPKIDFQRSPQIYTDADLISWKESLLETTWRIQNAYRSNIWPCCDDSCYNYGRCSFATLCEQNKPLGEENLDGFHEADPWDVKAETARKDSQREKILKEVKG